LINGEDLTVLPYFKIKAMSEKIYVKFLAPCKGFAYQVGAEDYVDKDRIAESIAMGKAIVVAAPEPRYVRPEKPQPMTYNTRKQK
jgi:hypothetical protein